MSVLCQPLSEPAGTSPSATTSQDDCSDTCSAIQNSDKSTIPPVIRNAPIARTTPKRSFMKKTPIRTPNSALHSLMAETGPLGRELTATRKDRYPPTTIAPAPHPAAQQ